MMGVYRVAGTLLCHHLVGNPGANCRSALYRAEKLGPRAMSRVFMCVIFPRIFKRIFGKHYKNVTQYDGGVSSS